MRKQLHLIPIHGRVLPAHIVPLEKGKAHAIGHVSHRKDGDYRKVAKNKWVRVRKPSEQESVDEKAAKERAFINVKQLGGPMNLTNLPDWAIGGVYNFGGYTWVALRPLKALPDENNDAVVLSSDTWNFVELTTGLKAGTGETPEAAKKDAEQKVQNMANMGQVTIQEKLDQAVGKAHENVANEGEPREFTGPYIRALGKQDYADFGKEVAAQFGDYDDHMGPGMIKAAIHAFYDTEIVGSETGVNEAELWFSKNRDKLPDTVEAYVRAYVNIDELAKNMWEMAKTLPTYTSELFSMYDAEEGEYIDAIRSYISDRMENKWKGSNWKDFVENLDLHELEPSGWIELSEILQEVNEVFEDELTPYDGDEEEDEYEPGAYDDPYDTLPDEVHFDSGTWEKSELYDLGAWVTGTVQTPRNLIKSRDNRRRENPDYDEGVANEIANTIIEKSTRHPEVPVLFRGTTNPAWKEAKPGDVLEVGIASFSHDRSVSAQNFGSGYGGSVLVLRREDYDGGGFLGVDIDDMISDIRYGGDPEAQRMIHSAQVAAHAHEREFVLRAPRLEVISVEEQQSGPPHVNVRLVDADLLEKAIWNVSEDYDRIARMEQTFDYHLADEPEEWA